MTSEDVENLGPLRALVGTWQGEAGLDHSPSDDPKIDRQPVDSKYREQLTLVPIGRVDNHEQTLWGLKYATEAWRLSTGASFHQENGYWLWDPASQHVMRCFIVPRGITVLAGGHVTPDAKSFTLVADRGDPRYGVCSAPFLDREFRTLRYELKVEIGDDGSFSYREDTIMWMKGRDELFHHSDENRLMRVEP